MVEVWYGYSPVASYLFSEVVMLVSVHFHQMGQGEAWLVCGVPGVQAPGVCHRVGTSVSAMVEVWYGY